MKSVELKFNFLQLEKNRSFFSKDFVESPKYFLPGEWIEVATKNEKYIGFINLNVDSGPVLYVLCKWSNKNPEELLSDLVKQSIARRSLFLEYGNYQRLIFGEKDSLPGLIVDQYNDICFVQINTAGLDKYRDLIKILIENETQAKVFFLDNQKYRLREGLVVHPKDSNYPESIEIVENSVKYKIPVEMMQKIGFYYDHRENRKKLFEKIQSLNFSFKKGLDLFSYVGAWGLHLLKAGVENVTFVDQANLGQIIDGNLVTNGMQGRGKFYRADVFKFLEDSLSQGDTFDVIVSDPPAFSKSRANQKMALKGYKKLHQKILDIANDKCLIVVASCTHGVGFYELEQSFATSAYERDFKFQLLDLGIQGHDHPFSSLQDKEHYIKYLLYYIEKK
ncbi:MAG: class I SAM-dependent rRNA methyltransferase [Halobacteriovoraceae bacterium]|nr:class I SAM-dependent rRNA methyltransferase [Halobacteriovoraceae bacterium]